MNDFIGIRLGIYEIKDQLGHGNMGVVYRAMNRLNGQTVALKQILGIFAPPASDATAGATEPDFNYRVALAREFQVLASLRHPHIVSVMDYGFDHAQQPYFTMQFLEESKTIKEAARNKPPGETVRILVEM